MKWKWYEKSSGFGHPDMVQQFYLCGDCTRETARLMELLASRRGELEGDI